MEKSISLNIPLEKSGGKLWGWYIAVDNSDVERIKDLGWNRLIARIEDADPHHCAIVPLGHGLKGITLNKPFVEKNGFVLGQKLAVELREDKSKYGMPISEEFYAAMEEDAHAKGLFEKLTPGKKRNLIYYVDNVKSSDIKIRRALVVLNHLKLHAGKIDFKDLTQEMKEANNREKLL